MRSRPPERDNPILRFLEGFVEPGISMTVIELSIIVLVIVGGILGGMYGSGFGPWVQIAGIAGGFILGFLCSVVLWGTVFGIVSIQDRWRPDRPKCKSGRCYSDHYDSLSWSPDKLTKRERQLADDFGGLIYRCRCGTTYLASQRRFLEVLPDGSVKPYMFHKPFSRQWQPDLAPEEDEG